MKASVILTAHKKPNRLRLTIAGLVGQKNRDNFEIIVVSDSAVESVKKVLFEYTKEIKVVEVSNKGRAAARNIGAKNANSDLFVFVDDDILVESNFIDQHIQAQSNLQGLVKGKLREILGLVSVDNPATGGVGCKPINIDELKSGYWTSNGIRLYCNVLEEAAEKQEGFYIPWLLSAGANISVSRKHWLKIGGFDESYGLLWGLEDIDFGYRINQAGIPITFCETAQGLHMSHPRGDRWQEQLANLELFQRKNSCPASFALPSLLSANGSVKKFRERLYQMEQLACFSP